MNLSAFSKKFERPSTGLFLLRIAAGVIMISSGIPKFLSGSGTLESVGSAISMYGVEGQYLVWGIAAAAVEVIGGLMLLLGCCFRASSLLLFLVMLTAFLSHFKGATGSVGAICNTFREVAFLPFMLMMSFAGLFFTGPGEYSTDGGSSGKGSSSSSAKPAAKKAE
jgi:uncharacterized membrane protein YphA (DoxX/SURF4 family)